MHRPARAPFLPRPLLPLLAAVLLAAVLVAPAALPVRSAGAAAEPTPTWQRTQGGRFHQSSPTVADVDGDGQAEIVIGDLDGWLHVFRANGTYLPGWPQLVRVDGAHPTAVESSPTVADLDNDGAVEIIVGAASTWVPDQHGGIVVFHRNGAVRWRWQTADEFRVWGMLPNPDGWSDGVFSTPAVGDIDGDRYPDIVFGGWDLRIHALDRNGRELPGFPMWNDDTIWSSPSLYDIDGDGRLEIFIGGDSSAGGVEPHAGGMVRALDWANGGLRQLWKRTTAEVVMGSPAVADLNGDGRLELVTSTGSYYGNLESRRLLAFHLDNGSDVPGWPVTLDCIATGSPAVGDLTHDDGGRPEVVVGDWCGNVYAFRGNGVLHWKQHLAQGEIISYPIIADLDGNGHNDVVIGTGWATNRLNGLNGGSMGFVGSGWTYQNAAAVGSFGGQWKLIVAGFHGGPDRPEGAGDTDGRIAFFNMPAPGTPPPWPMWRKNPQHLGADPSGGDPIPPGFCSRPVNPPSVPSSAAGRGYWVLGVDGAVYAFNAPFHGSFGSIGVRGLAAGIASTPSGNGYWVLARDGGVFTFGDAPFHGSLGATRLNAPIVNIAPTASGRGYWLLGADGGVFTFGDARFFGSTGGLRLNAPVISMTPTPSGNGYWLLASDGGVFTFGDARFAGSTGNVRLNAPVVSMAAHPTGGGYWLVARDGGVFSFGVPFHGSLPGTGICSPPATMQLQPTRTGGGYWVLAADGGVFAFGDAPFVGAAPGRTFANMAIDLAVS